MCRTLLLAACAVAAFAPVTAQAQGQGASFNLPARDLGGALTELARQSNREIYFSSDLTRGLQAPALQGRMSVEDALERLLEGSGLRYRINASGAIVVEPAAGEGPAAGAAAEIESAESEIVITGSTIRGVTPRSSPLTVLDRRELDARGATTAEQAVNTLTQNFNSVSATGISGDQASFFNPNALNGVDLRGLGPGTTLVLLNGRRLSGSDNGRVVDISLIPMPAVERIEILTDSASSVYGSDAVGGVVNFILLDRYEGLEARLGYGTTDDGAQDEASASITGGLRWSSGNFVASAAWLDRSALDADERDFSRGVGGPLALVPAEERAGIFVRVRQEVGERFTIVADGLHSRRSGSYALFQDGGAFGQDFNNVEFKSRTWFGSLGATWEVSNALTADLVGSYSTADDSNLFDQELRDGRSPVDFLTLTQSRTWDITGRLSGRLLTLPGGNLSFSLGAGIAGETFANERETFRADGTTSVTQRDRDRTTRYAYAELSIPVINPNMGMTGVHRLEINASARYSDYSDFGGNLSPKLGLLWSVAPGFNLRGSFGRTFRAPYLADIGGIGTYLVLDVAALGLPNPLPGSPPIGLYIDTGVAPDLGPETSNLLALGMDLRPPAVPGLDFSLTYVAIDYTNRIARGDPSRGAGYYLQPQSYPELFNFSPTRDDFASILASSVIGLFNNASGFDLTNPDALAANVSYILDNRLRNISVSSQQAVDVTASYAFSRNAVEYSAGASATLILESEARTTASSPSLSQINILGRPVDLRANAWAGFAVGGLSGRLTGRYVAAYENPFTPDFARIGDWLTFDLTAAYDFGDRQGPLSGLSVNLTVQNLLDTDPPYVAELGPGSTSGLLEPIGFDPSNANPRGRFIALELRKRF